MESEGVHTARRSLSLFAKLPGYMRVDRPAQLHIQKKMVSSENSETDFDRILCSFRFRNFAFLRFSCNPVVEDLSFFEGQRKKKVKTKVKTKEGISRKNMYITVPPLL